MRSRRDLTRAGVLLTAASLSIGAGVSPSEVELTLAPGESAEVTKTVETPLSSPRADVYFLADTTGSMSSAISNVKTSFSGILDQLNGTGNDIAVGAGDYKDFPNDPYAFRNSTPITSDGGGAATSTVNAWGAGGGGDGSEGQLFALHTLAADPAIGWREDAARIVVWFGDAPGHDPICAAISDDVDEDITEASAISALQAADISVIAVSTIVDFYPDGLDDDPQSSAGDYTAACDIGGEPGQASRVAAATDGLYLDAPSNDQVAATILAALQALPFDVVPQATCDEGLTITTSPESHTGVAPGDSVTFTETVAVDAEAAPGAYECSVAFTLNGSVTDAFTQTVSVAVEASEEPVTPEEPGPVVGPIIETDLPAGGTVLPLAATGLVSLLFLGLALRGPSERR